MTNREELELLVALVPNARIVKDVHGYIGSIVVGDRRYDPLTFAEKHRHFKGTRLRERS